MGSNILHRNKHVDAFILLQYKNFQILILLAKKLKRKRQLTYSRVLLNCGLLLLLHGKYFLL
jgi:hypothetical protein